MILGRQGGVWLDFQTTFIEGHIVKKFQRKLRLKLPLGITQQKHWRTTRDSMARKCAIRETTWGGKRGVTPGSEQDNLSLRCLLWKKICFRDKTRWGDFNKSSCRM